MPRPQSTVISDLFVLSWPPVAHLTRRDDTGSWLPTERARGPTILPPTWPPRPAVSSSTNKSHVILQPQHRGRRVRHLRSVACAKLSSLRVRSASPRALLRSLMAGCPMRNPQAVASTPLLIDV